MDEQTPRDLGHGVLSGIDSTVVFLTENNTKARKPIENKRLKRNSCDNW